MTDLAAKPRSPQTEFFRQLVRDRMQAAAVVARTAPLQGAVALLMAGAQACIVVDANGRPVGVLSRKDVLERVLWRVPPEDRVETVMSALPGSVSADTPLFQAVGRMRRENVGLLAVVDADGGLAGMISFEEALVTLSGRTVALIEQLTHEETIEGLGRVKEAQAQLAGELLAAHVPAPEVQALLSEINCDIHRRVLRLLEAALAEDGWGPPPLGYALIIMGSGGRGENFLAPDQDNGFILADHGEDERAQAGAYFGELARRMTTMLAAIGFELCKGQVMASSPLWRRTVSEWRGEIDTWIRRAEPEMLLKCDILFDFRHVHGDPALAAELRSHITAAIAKRPRFLRRLFAIEADHTVALGWFGRLRAERGEDVEAGMINLKLSGTLPLVEGVRLLALKAGIAETATLARLDGLRARNAIHGTDHAALADAFSRITRLLLARQLDDLTAGREASDLVPEAALSDSERRELVVALKAVGNFRQALATELAEVG